MRPSVGKMRYQDVLDDMWEKHLKPKDKHAPTVISTFAGGGGSSLGYSAAGFRELLAVEWDKYAVETLRLNFPNLDIYHGDIAKISTEEVLSRTGLLPGELDILDGSPPCQGFSTAGQRVMDDPRNQLFREFVRLLRGLKPKVFVMENVSGMVKGKMRLVFVDILKELKASGYHVSVRLLNAKYYGIPQSRERLIFIGVREDLGIEPSHPVGKNNIIPVETIQTIDSPVGDISSRVQRIWHKLKPGQLGSILPESRGNNFGICRVDPKKPCPTILKSHNSTGTGLLHWSKCRKISIPEMAQIGSFGLQYKFVGGTKGAINQIGNSVPPVLMWRIANHIRKEILDRCVDGEAPF